MKKKWIVPALFLGALPVVYVISGSVTRLSAADRTQYESGDVARSAPDQNASVRDMIWEECEVVYEFATLEEIETEIDAFRKAIGEDAAPFYDSQFGALAFEIEGYYEPGVPYEVNPIPDQLCARRLMPNGVVGKVVLPIEEFPETYELMYRAQWLQHQKLNRSAIAYDSSAK